MNMLASLKSDRQIEGEKDVLGGGSFVRESGAYPFKITMAYVKKSDSGALGLHLTVEDEESKESRYALYMTSGDSKGNKNYYVKDDKEYYLPGYLHADSIATLATGKSIADLDQEEKTIKIYNTDAKAEVPTKVQAVPDLIGTSIVLGIIKQTVDKTVKGADGVYVANGETREQNEIDKVFCARESHLHMTTSEVRAGAEKAEFYGEWVKANAGKTRNKAKGAAGNAGAPGKPAAAAGSTKPKSNLFG